MNVSECTVTKRASRECVRRKESERSTSCLVWLDNECGFGA